MFFGSALSLYFPVLIFGTREIKALLEVVEVDVLEDDAI